MEKTELFLENRIKWKANQHNLPNKNVFLFEKLDEDIQTKYQILFKEKKCGKIILLFTDSSKIWTALGTNMIIGFDGVNIKSIKLSSIKDIISKNLKEQHLRAEFGETKLKKIKKRNESELSVIDFDDNEIVFHTKKGNDFFSLWSILIMISRLNEKTGYNRVDGSD